MGSIDNGGHGSMMRFAIDRLAGRDLRDIALKAQVELDEGNGNRASLSFDTFGTRVRLSCPGFSFAPALGLWHELVILHALDIADGTQPTGVPVAFGQLTDGLARGSDFDRRATSAFKGFLAADDRDASGFLSACDSLGAKRIDSKADVGLVLHLLPCYPIYLNVWLADEEFPASAKLMVDAASDHILTLEDAVTVGELLLGLLSDALSPRV